VARTAAAAIAGIAVAATVAWGAPSGLQEYGAPRSAIRQILGRPVEGWGAGSGVDELIVVRVP